MQIHTCMIVLVYVHMLCSCVQLHVYKLCSNVCHPPPHPSPPLFMCLCYNGIVYSSTSLILSAPMQHLLRTGWVRKGVKEPEDVAGHMYRMALMAFLFTPSCRTSGQPSVDRERCEWVCVGDTHTHTLLT